ncbi:SDR family NAD(P)-dependent oxidoreductase [soil metagenome]
MMSDTPPTTTINADERYLDGRHAIVTGGGRGIGAAVAEALARRGANVTVMGRTMATLRRGADDLRQRYGVSALAVECDVSDEKAVGGAFAHAVKEHGDAYVLVNNAGRGESARFTEMDRELWDRTIAVNLTGTYLCTSRVLPAMLAAGAGRVVNIASTAALLGYRTMSAYCAAKHGVLGLTRAVALETAGRGVTVNAVCPGYTDTDLARTALDNIKAAKGVAEDEALAILLRAIPQKRLTTPAEVAAAVAWLCAPDSSAVTGIALPIAGGEV